MTLQRNLFALLLAFAVTSAQAATITVNDTGDAIRADGVTTLREAIVSINAGADANLDVAARRSGVYGDHDAIQFIIGAGPQTISPASALPAIRRTMTIAGSTQPGFAGAALITIDGASAGAASYGLVISSLTDTSVDAVRVQNFPGTGIAVVTATPDATPVAGAQSVTAVIETAKNIQLTATDRDNAFFTFAIENPPGHGTISGFDATTGSLIYTPAPGFAGSDAFTFTASDTTNTSAPATVSIAVTASGGATMTANGTVRSRTGTSLLVNSQPRGLTSVITTTDTIIRKRGKIITVADIEAGDEVNCLGNRIDAQTMVARQIEVRGGGKR